MLSLCGGTKLLVAEGVQLRIYLPSQDWSVDATIEDDMVLDMEKVTENKHAHYSKESCMDGERARCNLTSENVYFSLRRS